MLKKIVLLFILSAIISCNFHIEKRKYFKGYHIEIAKQQQPLPQKNDFDYSNQTETNSPHNFCSETVDYFSKVSKVKKDNSPIDAKSVDSKKYLNVKKLKIEKQTNSSIIKTYSVTKKSHTQIKKIKRKKKWDDFYLIGLFAIIGLSIIGLAKKFQSVVLSISNWASKNKLKTKALIGILQTGIALLGIGIGGNLNDLGYSFSANLSYLFSGTLLFALIVLIKQKKSSNNEPLKFFFRNKMAHATIALSSLMLMSVIGNNIGMSNPTNSPIGYMIEKNHFGLLEKRTSDSNHIVATFATEKDSKIDKAALVALYVFLAILMALVLMGLTCAVWCWAILSSEIGVLAIAFIATIFMILLAIYVISSMRRSIDKNEASKTPL